MPEQPSLPSQIPPEEDESPEVYSISPGKDGSLHLSRRDFLRDGHHRSQAD